MIINFLVKSLCEKESVYVNNLGLFRKEYEPAQIRDGMITPPGYKVVFDPDYDGNGFNFTMFVSQKGGMLITDATKQIDQWVSQLKTALTNNKSVSFENFGTFALNDKGIVTYICDRIAELNMEYEGMEPVSFSIQKGKTTVATELEDKVEHEIEARPEEEKTDEGNEQRDGLMEDTGDKTGRGHTVEDENEGEIKAEDGSDTKEDEGKAEKDEDNAENEVNEPTDKDEAKEEKDDEDIPKRHRGWIWLVILLLLALLAAAAYYFKDQLKELYNKYFGQTTEVVVENTPVVTDSAVAAPDTLVVDSLALNQDSLSMVENTEEIDDITTETTPSIQQRQAPNTGQLPDGEKFFINFEQGKHYVIVGSFRNENEVRQHIKQRKLEQYNPKVVLQPNSKQMRICIGIFDTEATADNYGRNTGLNYWVLN